MRGPSVLYIMSASHPRYELLRKRLDVFTSVLHRVEEGDVRALHRTRVASRRLREVLPILQVDPATTRKLVRRLRRVTDRLGSVRELDVLLLLLEELHESGRQDDAGLKRVVAVVSEERNEARKRLYEKLPTAELRRLANRLTEVSRELESARSDRRKDLAWRWAVDARIARRAQRLATAMGEAGAVYLPERLHVVRISLKKFRYAVELRNAELLTGLHGEVLKRHRVAHVFNSWTEMPTIGEQLEQSWTFPADFTVVRALLKPGRRYADAVKAFEPYDRIQEPQPQLRRDLIKAIQEVLRRRIEAFILANNRAEGNAPGTIREVAAMWARAEGLALPREGV